MDQLILRNLEEGMIAEEQAQHHPRSRRGQHHRAHHRRMEIAHDLLKRKQHRCQRRIKRGCNGCRRSHWDQLLYLLGAQSEEASEDGSNARANLNRRPFASQRDSAGKRCRRAEELAEHGAQRDAPFAREQRSLRLRHAAASRIRKIAMTAGNRCPASPRPETAGVARERPHRIQPHPHSFRQQDECDDRQAQSVRRSPAPRPEIPDPHVAAVCATRCNSGVLHQLPLVAWPSSLIDLRINYSISPRKVVGEKSPSHQPRSFHFTRSLSQ